MHLYETYRNPAFCTELPYLLTTPSDFDPKTEHLPLILFLHGAGERGVGEQKLSVHGIPRYFGANADYGAHRVITLSPQCPEGEVWIHLTALVKALLDDVVKTYGADPDRLSVTGISMGGFGTWDLLCSYPDTFAAAAPICGGGMSWNIHTKTPVRAFHGDADGSVPLKNSLEMVDALNAHGGHADLTIYHGCGHNSWTRSYEQTDLIAWLAGACKSEQ
jgi:predicted peptidase